MASKREMWLLIVDDDPAVLSALRSDLAAQLGRGVHIETCASGNEALSLLDEVMRRRGTASASAPLVPVVITDLLLPGLNGLDFLRKMRDLPLEHPTFNILLTGHAEYESVRAGINEGLIQRALGKPWDREELYHAVKDLFSEFLLVHAFDQIEHHSSLVSHDRYSKALLKAEERQRALSSNLRTMHQGLVAPQHITLHQLVDRFRAAFETLQSEQSSSQMLQRLEPGERLFQEGEQLSSMWLVLSGTAVHRKQSAGEKVLFREGVGHILGAMAFFTGEGAFTSVEAEGGSLEVACLRPDVLESLFARDPATASLFVNILLRQGMTRVKQHIEQGLKLSNALEQLKATETQLVESEKLATLGQLVAGIAHELNNPTAALTRASEHVHVAVARILTDAHRPSASGLELQVFNRGHDAEPLSTRTIRETAEVLVRDAGVDLQTGRDLCEMGFTGTDDLRRHLNSGHGDLALQCQHLLPYFQAGKFLRNIETSSMRIAELVASLKNYARPVGQTFEPVDVNRGLEDTVLLLHNRLKRVDFSKEYDAHAPVMGISGELNQVWTNLLTNALDAVAGQVSPQIAIRTHDDFLHKAVVVTVEDNGCGIALEKQNQIFELNYTTKKQGHFGLGLGLAICMKVVHKHCGTIAVDSRPGLVTRFTVTIPFDSKRRENT